MAGDAACRCGLSLKRKFYNGAPDECEGCGKHPNYCDCYRPSFSTGLIYIAGVGYAR